jgi:predicted RNA-binding protein with PIN domain
LPYLVDGNNLCGAARDKRLCIPMDEGKMIGLLASFAERRSSGLVVVFDGSPGRGRQPGRIGRLTVDYSGKGRPADDVLVDMVREAQNPKNLTLVSSDRRLRDRVRALGCRVMGCRQFAGILNRTSGSGGRDSGEDEKPSPGDIEEWERYFAGED